MELYLIRHPRPEVLPGTCYGQTDLGLAESPLAVAERIRPLLPAPTRSMPAPCAAPACWPRPWAAPQVDPRLMEIHFGEWEGRSFDEIGQAALDAWSAAPLDFAPPGGESPRQMATRALDFLACLRAGQPARCGRDCPWRPPARPGWPAAGPAAGALAGSGLCLRRGDTPRSP
jgi:alpha-ribazole phosphatase